MKIALVILYVVAAGFEIAGTLIVLRDIRESQRALANAPRSSWDIVEQIPKYIALGVLGNARRRLLGVVLLVSGLLLGLVGNIVSTVTV